MAGLWTDSMPRPSNLATRSMMPLLILRELRLELASASECQLWPVVKTATTRFQYSGLKCSAPSTRMKRIGRDGSMSFISRLMCSMLAPVELAAAESAGMNCPPSRKDFMFEMRRREDAEGESMIIGSGLLGF